MRDEEGFFEVAALVALCGTSRLSLPGLSLPGQDWNPCYRRGSEGRTQPRAMNHEFHRLVLPLRFNNLMPTDVGSFGINHRE